jgi:hypothetical protein
MLLLEVVGRLLVTFSFGTAAAGNVWHKRSAVRKVSLMTMEEGRHVIAIVKVV